MIRTGVPADWYRTSFAPNFEALYWDEGAEEKVALALEMLRPDGHERILDLACATGRRTKVPFQRRLYTVEELAEIFESVGLRLANVFDEQGAPCAPTDAQQEIYVEARA